jgi:hypothetical protein
MSDEIDRTISKYLGHDLGDGDDEIDDVVAEYGSAHASERLARQRRAVSPRRAKLTRRATSLTVMSGDAALLAERATLSENERLVVSDDGVSIEVVSPVEEDETVEGEVVILRG